MRSFSFDLAEGRPCLLLTITKADGEVVRVTTDTVATNFGSPDLTWETSPGIKVGDLTERNDGTPPSISFEAIMEDGGAFDPAEVDGGKFEGAEIEIDLTSGKPPTARDFWFIGKMIGNVDYDLGMRVSFECISKFGIPADILVRQYQLLCDADFGDPLRCKIPVLPDDVARLETIAVGETRRVRFAPYSNPEDYANVYLEATAITTGTTAASEPAFSSAVGAVVVDGGVTWTTRNAWTRAVRIASATDTHNLVMDRDPDPRGTAENTWFNPGTIIFRSGWNSGRRYKIGKWVGSTRTITSYLPMGTLVAVNDWAELSPDCDHTLAMCVAKYSNPANHRGFPNQAGAKAQAATLGF